MKYRQIALALLTAAALVAAAAFVTTSPVSADVDSATAQAIADAEANAIRCQAALDAGGLTSAERNEATRCVHINQAALRRLVVSPSPTYMSPSPTQPPVTSVTSSPTPSFPPPSTPPPTSSPPAAGYPSPATTGVPPFWQPLVSRGSWTITAAGVYEDVRVTGSITVAVANVTLRRVEVVGGRIWAETSGCNNGLMLEQVTVRPASGVLDVPDGAVGPGGYTARRVALLDVTEGFRSGGGSVGCGPVTITDSFVRVRGSQCHCDGLQVYDGAGLSVDGLTIDWSVNEGTTAFFAPSGERGPVRVRRLLLKGGGYALTDGIAGSVEDYFYVANSAVYGAMSVNCSLVSPFSARIGTIDASYQPTSAEPLACGAGNGQ